MSPRGSKGKKTKKSSGSSDKPPVDAYTGFLVAGFFAILTGCILLVVELSKYEWTAAN